ncbi:MAG TPA: beta-ketoacyl-[acyl-carrier-protein] synthase family protein [Pirellulales bacterium]|jgi:3-oxoacyl-[acyl-carrier-protein] synthase II|nr:beta-ketoacyl-[acyl-carrier-protein] synthase family protein [Pirellulales bacterium]
MSASKSPVPEVVVTGLGVVSPIGIGISAFWNSLDSQASGIRRILQFDTSGVGIDCGGEVLDFDAKDFVKPRKSLKVMSRDIQLGVVAATLATQEAGITAESVHPERMGIAFGADMMHCEPEDISNAFRRSIADGRFDFRLWGKAAMEEIYPLWMLKYLPNMPACHIAIAHDARGPNNSHSLSECSSLMAIGEAVRVIERGDADVMIGGGTGTRVQPMIWVRSSLQEVTRRRDAPEKLSRPFDALRDGFVNGEGAAALVLERRDHAQARGVKIWARVLGYGSSHEPRSASRLPDGSGTRRAIVAALRSAGMDRQDIGHVNAHGLSTVCDDRAEARAIRAELDDVPVTAPKSYFGNLAAGTGAVEAVASVLALERGRIPVTLNYERPDPECPINVVAHRPLSGTKPTALLLNHAVTGQSVAVVIAAP